MELYELLLSEPVAGVHMLVTLDMVRKVTGKMKPGGKAAGPSFIMFEMMKTSLVDGVATITKL